MDFDTLSLIVTGASTAAAITSGVIAYRFDPHVARYKRSGFQGNSATHEIALHENLKRDWMSIRDRPWREDGATDTSTVAPYDELCAYRERVREHIENSEAVEHRVGGRNILLLCDVRIRHSKWYDGRSLEIPEPSEHVVELNDLERRARGKTK